MGMRIPFPWDSHGNGTKNFISHGSGNGNGNHVDRNGNNHIPIGIPFPWTNGKKTVQCRQSSTLSLVESCVYHPRRPKVSPFSARLAGCWKEDERTFRQSQLTVYSFYIAIWRNDLWTFCNDIRFNSSKSLVMIGLWWGLWMGMVCKIQISRTQFCSGIVAVSIAI